MARCPKKLFAFIIAVFVSLALLCAAFAAPGQAIASVTECSQMPGRMAMAGCKTPPLLCRLDAASLSLTQGALSSARYDLSKSAHDLCIGDIPFDSTKEAALIGKNSEQIFLDHRPGKVSTRLLNSILNL